MHKSLHRLKKAFTLIELMVVVAIIAVLAALIVPALQKAQTAAAGRACMAKIRGFPATLRAYSTSWEGWTHADKDYYIKLAGFQLSWETGFNAGIKSRQTQDKTLICPVDGNAGATDHGVRTSYRITGDFVGANLMAMTGDASKILCGIEKGKRHPIPGTLTVTLEGHYSYADGTATLGYPGPALPGMNVRVYNSSSDSAFSVPEADLPDPLGDTTISGGGYFQTMAQWTAWGDSLQDDVADWSWDPAKPSTNRTDLRHTNTLKNFMYRFDGILKFPSAGDWVVGGVGFHYSHTGWAMSKDGSSSAKNTNDLDSFRQLSHHGGWGNGTDGNRARNLGSASDGHARSRYRFKKVDNTLPFYRFAMWCRTTTGQFYLLRGGMGMSWILQNPANYRTSLIGNSRHGQQFPKDSLFRLP